MKAIYCIIAILVLGFCAKAQDTLKSDIVLVTLPKQTQRLSIEQAIEKIGKVHLRHPEGFKGYLNIFDIDGVVAIMRDDTITNKEYTLKWHKSDLEGLSGHSGITTLRSEIKKVNGIYFHIFQQGSRANGVLIFASDIKDYKMFFCKLIYNLTDRRKAQKAFDVIIKGFKYKKT